LRRRMTPTAVVCPFRHSRGFVRRRTRRSQTGVNR
jgi:hypothetical protein